MLADFAGMSSLMKRFKIVVYFMAGIYYTVADAGDEHEA